MAEQELLFEGFLRKRRDKMKLKWVTYWFRLESTTLFFYSKKDGRALNLRGQYYLYMVESVREVNRVEGKRYVFEINLKNRKKKVLAADSEHLRHLWMQHLWKAIESSSPAYADPSSTWQELPVLKKPEEEDISLGSSDSDSGKRMTNDHGISLGFGQWDSPGFKERETRSFEATDNYVNWKSLREHWDEGEDDQQEDDYETLELRTGREKEEVDDEREEDYYAVPPPRTAKRSDPGAVGSTLLEDIYDYPLSYRNSCASRLQGYRECAESIYDVPRSFLRKLSERSVEGRSEGQSSADSGSIVYEGMRGLRRDSSISWTTEVEEG